jgi:hypothetical protein
MLPRPCGSRMAVFRQQRSHSSPATHLRARSSHPAIALPAQLGNITPLQCILLINSTSGKPARAHIQPVSAVTRLPTARTTPSNAYSPHLEQVP